MNPSSRRLGMLLQFCAVASFELLDGPCLRAETKGSLKDAAASAVAPAPVVLPQAGSALRPLEFRGLLIDDEGEYFKITERDTQASIWLGLNETGHPFVVRRYDSRRQVVTVEYQRRKFALPLRKSLARRKEPVRHRLISGEETPTTGEGSLALREGPSDAALPETAAATQTTGSVRREAIDRELTKPATTSQEIGQPITRDRP